ncbi:lysophospholipase, putative [Plasmodium chabaudi adami]|uniref:Lysophospholipase, putative n=1 Tax=Plasmodium chabaudi adami TaxID=5826 RepID=A0A1C6WNU5_PLACE|nr:lysophospholipase, putative [Plasmodium chabaudi adami]
MVTEEIELSNDELKSTTQCKLDGDPKIGWLRNKNGLLLKTYGWLVNNAIGIIFLIHGLKSHTRLTYMNINLKMPNNNEDIVIDDNNYYIYKDSWIEHFNKIGYSVYALDLQGHGESQSFGNLRGNFNYFDDLVDDVIQYMNQIQDEISNDNQTDYEIPNDNQTDYEIPNDDQTDYEIPNDDQMDYEVLIDNQTNDDISNYNKKDDEILNDNKKNDEILNDNKKDDEISNDNQASDGISNDNQMGDEISNDNKKDDEISNDNKKDDDIPNDNKKDDEISNDNQMGDEISNDNQMGDEISNDNKKDDEISNDNKKDDEISNDNQMGDEISNDNKKDDEIPNDDQMDYEIPNDDQMDYEIPNDNQTDYEILNDDQTDYEILNDNQTNDDISNDNQASDESHDIVTPPKKRLPMYIIGHSMGGNIALRILELLGKEKEDSINAGNKNNYKKFNIILDNYIDTSELYSDMEEDMIDDVYDMNNSNNFAIENINNADFITNSNDYDSENSRCSTSDTTNSIVSDQYEGCHNYLDKLNIKGCASLSGMMRIKTPLDAGNTTFKYLCLPIINFLSRVAPHALISAESRYKRSEYVANICKHDKFRNNTGIKFKCMAELIKATITLDCNIDYLPKDIPLLFIHSIDDTICCYKGSAFFYDKAKVDRKELYIVENMNHAITAEPGNEEILKSIIDWIHDLERNDEDEIGDEIENEIGDEIRDEIENEIKGENENDKELYIVDGTNDDITEEPEDEYFLKRFINWIWNFRRNSEDEIENEIGDEIENEIGDEKENEIGDEKENGIGDEIGDEKENEIGDEIKDEKENEIGDEIKDEKENEIGDEIKDEKENEIEGENENDKELYIVDGTNDDITEEPEDEYFLKRFINWIWNFRRNSEDEIDDEIGDEIEDEKESEI